MTLDLYFLAVAWPAAFLAGVSKGGFGSGASFVATPILALAYPPEIAIGIVFPVLVVIDLVTLRPYWQQWSWPDARLLILGSVPGMFAGVVLWKMADPNILRLLIGIIALAFVAYQLLRQLGWLKVSPAFAGPRTGLLSGAVGGFTSFISHAGGPVAAVYLLARGLDKTTYQATTVIVFFTINMIKSVIYLSMGILATDLAAASVAMVPAALLGAWVGVVAHRAIPPWAYFTVTYVLLTLAGLKLVSDYLTAG